MDDPIIPYERSIGVRFYRPIYVPADARRYLETLDRLASKGSNNVR